MVFKLTFILTFIVTLIFFNFRGFCYGFYSEMFFKKNSRLYKINVMVYIYLTFILTFLFWKKFAVNLKIFENKCHGFYFEIKKIRGFFVMVFICDIYFEINFLKNSRFFLKIRKIRGNF